jgi:hypothetical protein
LETAHRLGKQQVTKDVPLVMVGLKDSGSKNILDKLNFTKVFTSTCIRPVKFPIQTLDLDFNPEETKQKLKRHRFVLDSSSGKLAVMTCVFIGVITTIILPYFSSSALCSGRYKP